MPTYDELLSRLRNGLGQAGIKGSRTRLEIPAPQVLWIGNKTIFRNYVEFPRTLRRDPNKILLFLAKELATAASIDGERAIFIGRKDPHSFAVLINRYLKEHVLCPVCGRPDTREERVKRLQFIVCEACGARSPLKA
jgi:translation initiation factor 2 subunit 2